ncbi:MAG: LutC/YkgG family protein [Acidobacteriaceae bacterium]
MTDRVGNARDLILGRIREANRKAAGPDIRYEAIAREYQNETTLDHADILKLFSERLHEYDAQVWEATDATIASVFAEALVPIREHAVIASDEFPADRLPDGMKWLKESDADDTAMEKAAGAIVTCEVAIAHTGTIVLKGARTMTLLPDRLLCVVREEQVVETVPEAFARLQPIAAEALTFISGPSATADIEMTRIRGVHGPRFLDVVLLR